MDAGTEILLGTGKAASPYTQGQLLSYPVYSCPVTGDLNGDGKLDFALNSNLLAYGNGDGTFRTPAPFLPNVMSSNIVGIAAGRLNGDREGDIV